MKLLAGILLLQSMTQTGQVAPVLEFPEPGVDDPAAFEGYQTRFYRDAHGNTLQIYINQRDGRVVDVWGNSANESVGFTIRDGAGRPARITWDGDSAAVARDGGRHSLEYRLLVHAPVAEIGHFMLGTMRVERDFQHFEGHRQPFDAPPFERPELATLIGNLERLDPAERRRHLAALGARRVDDLRSRMRTVPRVERSRATWRARIEQPSFDGRNRLSIELLVPRAEAELAGGEHSVTIRARGDGPIPLVVRISTDAEPLTPLRYTDIFNEPFLDHYHALEAEAERIRGLDPATRTPAERDHLLRFHRTERQVRSLELLSSHEKLMAGLPNYGTYFGRDMLMTALMMEPVWTDRMAEYVIGSVLGKLAPTGEVSHEEALAGQAIREHAGVYNTVMEEYFRQRETGETQAAEQSLVEARRILSTLQQVRENYHMMDDDFQFPVFVARYLSNPAIPAEQKREFLNAPVAGEGSQTRLALLLRNLAYMSRMADPYVQEPVAINLIAFPPRTETDWFPGSWRDSNVGYANGRFAMDINVVWVPAALEGLGEIVHMLGELGFAVDELLSAPEIRRSPLERYVHTPAQLRRAVEAWRGTERHFLVTLSPAEIRERVRAKLAWMPAEERAYWSDVFERNVPEEELRFLALSLDAEGRPIPVVHTDVATRLFIEDLSAEVLAGTTDPGEVIDDVRSVMRPYPVGLLIQGIGPVVANDAYASTEVWEAFRRDHYHSPRVVWGREVSLLLLGLARQIDAAVDEAGEPAKPELAGYVNELRDALRRTLEAVEASGLKDQELWSYRIEGGELLPLRYAASTDLQLWNLTDLAVQYRLGRSAAVLRASAAH